MKTKNNLLKGSIIGISLIIVPLILMGTSDINTSEEIGRYQISTSYGDMEDSKSYIYETIIDTRNGKVISRNRESARYY